MTKGTSFAVQAVLLLGFLGVLPGPLTRAQEKQDNRHRSPRATVRTLLTVITLAREAPQRIGDAAACLDLSGLPANQKNTGGLLATQLEAILRARGVDTDQLPDEMTEAVFVFPDESGNRIALQRMPDGRWLFDRETVALIPKLYAETQKHRQDKNREAASLNVTPDYASPRATVRTLIEGYRRQDFSRILRCLDLSEIPAVAREQVGTQMANKLKQIIVRHRLPILQEIPDSNYSDPYVILSQPEGIIEVVRLASGWPQG